MHYLGILLILASIISAIMVLVKLFQIKGPLHGILGIFCGFYTYIWGWINCKTLNLTKLMLIWTLGGIIGYALIIPKMVANIQELQKQMEAQQQAAPAPAQ